MSSADATPPAGPDPSDGTLLAQIRDGDESAFGALLLRHWTPLVGFARRYIGETDGAEDVVQEAFVRIWRHRARWSGHGNARAFIYQIVRNLALQQVEKRQVRSRRLPHADDRTWAPPPDLVEAERLRIALEAAVNALPPRRREVFILSRFQGLSYAEIAETLSISTQTVANQMAAALKNLRLALEEFRS